MNYLLLTGTFLSVLFTQLYYYYKIKSLEAKAETLIETKVEDVIMGLLHEIPMAGTFLKGGLLEKIKTKAHERVKSLLPAVKAQGLSKSLLYMPWIIAMLVSLVCLTVYSLIF